MAYQYKMGTSQAGLVLVNTLPLAWPEDEYIASDEIDTLGSGLQRDMGFPIVNWHWGFLPRTHYTALRVKCPNRSGNIYIRSLDENSLNWKDMYTIYRFPAPVRFSADRAIDLTVQFIILQILADL